MRDLGEKAAEDFDSIKRASFRRKDIRMKFRLNQPFIKLNNRKVILPYHFPQKNAFVRKRKRR